MNVRKVNRGLWTLTGVLAAGSLACAAWGVLAPVEVSEPAVSGGGAPVAATQGSPDGRLGVEAFERIVGMKLRKPLDGAMAATTTNPAMVEQNPGPAAGGGAPFALVGTIGESLAMIQTASGVEVKAVGESANGARIVAIRPSQVDVEVAGGARVTITKPREPGGG